MDSSKIIIGVVVLCVILISAVFAINFSSPPSSSGSGFIREDEPLKRSRNPPSEEEEIEEEEEDEDEEVTVAPEVDYPIDCKVTGWSQCKDGDTEKTRTITLKNNSLGKACPPLTQPCPVSGKVEGYQIRTQGAKNIVVDGQYSALIKNEDVF